MLGQLLPDTAMGCLAHVVPERVPAESSSRLWSMGFKSVDDPSSQGNSTKFAAGSFHAGGMGARPNQDGLSATAFPSGVRTTPIEIVESKSAIIVRKKEFRTDTGGAGTWRGGLGQVMVIESTEGAPFVCSSAFDRIVFPARGRSGGLTGGKGRLTLATGEALPGFGANLVPAGNSVVVEMPGGGGFGDPRKRDPERVAADVREELISRKAAEDVYAVSVDDEGILDIAGTEKLRASAA